MLLAQINYKCSCLSRWEIIARLSVLSFAVCLGFVPSKSSDVSETTNRKCTPTLSSRCWRHVWVPNDVQRNIQVKLIQPRKESFHSITTKHHKRLIMGTKAAQADYVHTRVIKVTCTRTPRALSGELLLTPSLFPHFHTVGCVSVPPW